MEFKQIQIFVARAETLHFGHAAFLHPPMPIPEGLDQLVLERNRLVAVLP